MKQEKVPVSKKGLKIALLFGTLVGISFIIIMRMNSSFIDFVFDNVFIFLVIIGVVGGSISVIYTIIEYKETQK